jgi:hypothetical protein
MCLVPTYCLHHEFLYPLVVLVFSLRDHELKHIPL